MKEISLNEFLQSQAKLGETTLVKNENEELFVFINNESDLMQMIACGTSKAKMAKEIEQNHLSTNGTQNNLKD
ncbi:MAG: hypothetical protein K2P17_03235 [Helicobacteraceae bacterium]|nr:hypothetical protein [Helicobacteraceae bacterium]